MQSYAAGRAISYDCHTASGDGTKPTDASCTARIARATEINASSERTESDNGG
ncbi:hypothetical protein [Tenggerimyces flavus]|uniref:Uncharacterized protein n=1 Tax=Tenggerimyces flavus TaxID=1708749 RepID=A0ABV7YMN6_9ACTN|nr:hypothetical protein [Tenggerimyces flavus]MBM7788743.1 hypothetical protein [Tenggerimyces flavus]